MPDLNLPPDPAHQPVVVIPKPAYRSTTLIIAGLSLLTFALMLVLEATAVLEISPKVATILGIFLSVGMAALRWLRANPPIQGSPGEAEAAKQ